MQIVAHIASVLTAFLIVAAPLSAEPPDDKKTEEQKRPKAKFTIGKDTTYVDGPKDKDGFIDYEAALNERLSKGVKPEENAVVLLWQALGPHPEGAAMPPEFFKRLGVPAPPDQGDYLIDVRKFAKERLKIDEDKLSEIYDHQGRAIKRPWTAKQYPNIAAWLAANEKPLAVAIEATKRKQYYSPLVSRRTGEGPTNLLGVLLPGVQKCRELANALSARAMLRAGEGQFDDAWQDLLACHRLARLTGRGPTLIEALVGIAIDAIASNADLAFLDNKEIDAARIKNCLRDLQALPSMPTIAEKIDLGERFMFLDSVMMMMRSGVGYLEALAGGPEPLIPQPLGRDIKLIANWDPAMKSANRWYDRMVANLHEADRTKREKQFDKMDEELKAVKAKLQDKDELAKLFLDSADSRGKILGEILMALLMPAVRKVNTAGDRCEQIQRNLHVAFALAAYQRDNGKYPASLDTLTPKYLAKVPGDIFSGKSLIYRPSENGYLFYSVGANGKDENGHWYDDDPKGDDPGVRMPLPKLKDK